MSRGHAAALDDAVSERVRAIRAQSRPVFRGAALEAQTATDSELVLTGPAGTGKSIGLLHAIHRRAEKYPGSRHLILRKTRASLTNSALVTFEEKVLPKGHPVLFGDRGQRLERKNRSGYSYPNGSMIDLGGMDEATRLYSTEYDSVYWQEATEGTLTEWQSLLRSLRNNRMPFQQLAGDCNPSVPTHWIQDRAKSKALRLLESRHRDNPALWDGTDWTPYGTAYMAKLERLTGVLRNRLYLGLWVAAEGVVYDTFDATIHVWPGSHLPAGFRPHPSWRRVLGIDWGFRHPLVVQWWAVDGDGRMYLYRELYRTGRLVADVAREVRRISREAGEVIECAVADPADPEAIVVFGRESGIRCEPGDKGPGSIKAGIESIKQRLAVQSDGRARIYFGADALLERDPVLAEEHLPTSTIEELAVYQYQEGRDGKPTREEPLDKDNHGCLVAETLVATRRGYVRLDSIQVGDDVLTRDGYRPVLASGMTQPAAYTITVTLASGAQLIGTGDHPVWVECEGWKRLDSLRHGDSLCLLDARSLCSMGSASDGIRMPSHRPIETTSSLGLRIESVGSVGSMRRFGRRLTDLFRKVGKFITPTGTLSTMISGTLCASPMMNTWNGIVRIPRSEPTSRGFIWSESVPWPPRGIHRRRVGSGTGGTDASCGSEKVANRWRANGAAVPTKRGSAGIGHDSARTDASPRRGEHLASMTETASAPGARASSGSISTRPSGTAHAVVVALTESTGTSPVFNLTVDGAHEFFANGILVHNCDAKRYVTRYLDGAAGPVERDDYALGSTIYGDSDGGVYS